MVEIMVNTAFGLPGLYVIAALMALICVDVFFGGRWSDHDQSS